MFGRNSGKFGYGKFRLGKFRSGWADQGQVAWLELFGLNYWACCDQRRELPTTGVSGRQSLPAYGACCATASWAAVVGCRKSDRWN